MTNYDMDCGSLIPDAFVQRSAPFWVTAGHRKLLSGM